MLASSCTIPRFDVIDYAVIAAYLIAMVALGAVFARRQRSLKEYFHASASLPWWAVGISLLATSLSPITYLASPGWIFLKDSRTTAVSTLLGLSMVPVAAAIWLPLWSRLRVMSIYEYLESRYHPSIRAFGAFLFLMGTVFWMGTALVTAGLGFERVTQFDGRWCLAVMVVLGTAYTVLGGMRAVIWTDVAQFLIFIVGYAAILVVVLALFDFEPMRIYEIASTTISQKTGYPHTKLISFELDPTVEATFWVILFGRFIGALTFGSGQISVQRLHATRSRREMLKSMFGSFLSSMIFLAVALPASWGFVAFYAQHPELKAGIEHPDQVMPDFVLRNLPRVFRSLIMAGVLAALMSSLDSAINSMSNVAINDFYRRYLVRHASEKHLVSAAKIFTVVFGMVLLVFSLWQFDHGGDTALEKLGKLGNLIASPVASFFLLGIFFKRTNTLGAVIGAAAGIAFSVIFNGIPGVLEPRLDWINWMWVGGLATIVNVVIGYAASFLFPPPRNG